MNEKLQQIIERLRDFHSQHARGPSYSELAKLAGYASKQAAYRLATKLIEAGVLERDTTGRLRLLPQPLGTRVLGYVQAGFPSPAEEELIDTISLDEYLIPRPTASFMLRVSGDSMIDAGIHPEDLVIVERGPSPSNGQIVLAEVDGEWTLKYYEKRGKHIRLIPANENYEPIVATQELKIGGIIKGVIRRY